MLNRLRQEMSDLDYVTFGFPVQGLEMRLAAQPDRVRINCDINLELESAFQCRSISVDELFVTQHVHDLS
jgi:hypothetical protein